jgi:hypothetical protein
MLAPAALPEPGAGAAKGDLTVVHQTEAVSILAVSLNLSLYMGSVLMGRNLSFQDTALHIILHPPGIVRGRKQTLDNIQIQFNHR